MASAHQPPIPVAIEQLIAGLTELEIVLGDAARPVLASVTAALRDAMAARDHGDPVRALRQIGHAMDQLAALADRLDPQEAMLMRAVSERFRTALVRGDLAEAKQDLEIMFDRSGALQRKGRD